MRRTSLDVDLEKDKMLSSRIRSYSPRQGWTSAFSRTIRTGSSEFERTRSRRRSLLQKFPREGFSPFNRFLRSETRLEIRSKGQVMIPIVLATVLFFASFAALLSVMRGIRREAETQIRLDRCVAETSLAFRDVINSLNVLNQRMIVLRTSIAAAYATPPLIPPLKAALISQMILQEVQRFQWTTRQVTWLVKRGCGQPGDLAPPLPRLDLTRDPADTIGPQALRWNLNTPNRLVVSVFHHHRAAAAELRKSNETLTSKIPNTIGNWKAAWTAPARSIAP